MRIVKLAVCCLSLLAAALFSFGPAGLAEGPTPATPPPPAQDICSRWPLPLPSQVGPDRFQQLLNQYVAAECYKDDKGRGRNGWAADSQIRDTGPFIADRSLGTHNPVRVYYSREVVKWLNEGRKKGDLKDGAVIIKEMYPNPAQQYVAPGTKCTDTIPKGDASYRCRGMAIMVRDEQGSWDGWFWTDGSATISYDSYPNAGFGLYCVNCHASAKTDSTFASLTNINGSPFVFNTTMGHPNMTKPLAPAPAAAADIAPAQRLAPRDDVSIHQRRDAKPDGDAPAPAKVAPARGAVSRGTPPRRMLSEWYDTAVQHPERRPRQMFLTSNQCIGCHSATQNNASQPNMVYQLASPAPTPTPGPPAVNLSPYGEWRSSMMGLSGRDPVFFAQLETEMNLHPEIAEEIVDTCMSCHGVMGQRQIHLDGRGMMRLEYLDRRTNQTPAEPFAEYGALARDGVSCAACHHISSEDFGKLDPRFPPKTPRFLTDTGRFKTGKADEIFGPYRDVTTVPMDNAIGVKPEFGEQVKSSALCGTCHTVVLPVLDVDRKYPKDIFEQALNARTETEHEQNTYIEWLNSDFQNEPAVARHPVKADAVQTCQDCHMPSKYPSKTGRDVQFKVASIEEDIFAKAEYTVADEDMHLRVRGADAENRYGRHTLVGLNLFVMEMFNQFPADLGMPANPSFFDPMAGYWGNAVPSMLLSKQSAVELARNETAKVEVVKVERTPQSLNADVRVTNLAGHRFPSGVSFRRAFINFRVEVQGAGGWKTVWQSGATNECGPGTPPGPVPCGVIGTRRGGQFTPLPTEFFDKQSNPQQRYQPHYEVITAEDQVQIYEELKKDSNCDFTTSFLSLKNDVKDNRLMPRGWDRDNYFAETTMPHFGERDKCVPPRPVNPDPRYFDGSGTDLVTYRVPASLVAGLRYRVTATLYYQAIPPYFLKQRYDSAQRGPNRIHTDTLRWFVNNLDVTSAADINVRNNPQAGWDQILKPADQMPVRDWKLMIASDQKTQAADVRGGRRGR